MATEALANKRIISLEKLDLMVLGFEGRTYNYLRRANIRTLGDLLKYSAEDLQKMSGIGDVTVNDTINRLNEMDIHLKGENQFKYVQKKKEEERRIRERQEVDRGCHYR